MQYTEEQKLVEWITAGEFQDILYQKREGIAKITINRPEVRNAFRPLTVQEMSFALENARQDAQIGVIILTGQGREAFCWRRSTYSQRSWLS